MIHGVGLLLISAAAGYWVLAHASKERGQLKQIGQWLGVIIIVVSLAGAACKLYYLTTGQSFGAKGFFCPAGKACPFGQAR